MDDVIAWPDDVAKKLSLSVPALQRQRAIGDHPRLYAITERTLVTTTTDLLEWVRSKAVPPGYKCRESVHGAKATKRGKRGSVFDSDLDE